MGLKSLINSAVQSAINTTLGGADGLSKPVIYVRTGDMAYDPETRKNSRVNSPYNGIVTLFVRFQIEDMKPDIKPSTDMKALIPALNLPFIPKEDDKLIDTDGTTWAVRKLLSDPSASLHSLHIRKE